MVDDINDSSQGNEEEVNKDKSDLTIPKEPKDGNPEAIIPDEVLDKIPPEARGEIKRMVSTMVSTGYVGPAPHPFAKKMTPEHIGKIIENSEKDDQRQFQNLQEERKMSLTIFFGILIPVVGLIVFFSIINKIEFLVPFISAIVGFGGGYGFGKSRK